eukprot:6492453-Amphidinium_carterae.2
MLHPDTSHLDAAVDLHARVLRMWKGTKSNPRVTDETLNAALTGEAKRLVAARSPWARVTGPAASLLMHAIRLEWEVQLSGIIWLPHSPFDVDVNVLTNRDLRAIAKRSTEDWVLRAHNEGKRVLGRAAAAFRQTLVNQSAAGREGLLRYLSGASWTSSRKFKKGFIDSDKCTLCRETGTVLHRLMYCPGWARLRAKKLHDEAYSVCAQLQREAEAIPEKLPPPARWFQLRPIGLMDFEEVHGDWTGITHLYTDGAAARPDCPTTRRASWAIYGRNAETLEEFSAFGLLPTFPEGNQTVHEAELYAIVRALQICVTRTPLVIHVDNLAVQVLASKLMQEVPHTHVRHGRLWQMLSTVARSEVDVTRVAAHQLEPSSDSPQWQHWWGNAQADRLAKKALTHWQEQSGDAEEMDFRLRGCRQLWELAAEIAHVSTMSEKSDIYRPENLQTDGVGTGDRESPQPGCRVHPRGRRKLRAWLPPTWMHELARHGDLMFPAVRTEKGRRSADPSSGIALAIPTAGMKLVPSKKVGPGHHLLQLCDAVTEDLLGFFCVRCAAYSCRRWCALAAPCKHNVVGREAQCSRVKRGWHPSANNKVRIVLRQFDGSQVEWQADWSQVERQVEWSQVERQVDWSHVAGNFVDDERASNYRLAWEM